MSETTILASLNDALCSLLHRGDEPGEHTPEAHMALYYQRSEQGALRLFDRDAARMLAPAGPGLSPLERWVEHYGPEDLRIALRNGYPVADAALRLIAKGLAVSLGGIAIGASSPEAAAFEMIDRSAPHAAAIETRTRIETRLRQAKEWDYAGGSDLPTSLTFTVRPVQRVREYSGPQSWSNFTAVVVDVRDASVEHAHIIIVNVEKV